MGVIHVVSRARPSSTSMSSSNEDKGPTVFAAILAVTILATLFVGARLYARGRILKRFFLDDYFVVLALVCIWASAALQMAAVNAGFGRHFDTLTQSQKNAAVKFNSLGFVPGILACGIPKLAVVALLTRVFANTAPRWHNIFLWLLAISCNIILATVAILSLLQCRPMSKLWNPSVEGTCWDFDAQIRFAVAASAVSAAVDLYLAVYPTIVLTILRINRIKKFMLSFALGCGFISAIVATYKATRVPKLASPDLTYAVAELSIWTIVEACTVIIAATIPVLQPLVYKLFGDSILGSKNKDRAIPPHHPHQRLDLGSDDTHVGPGHSEFDDSTVYTGQEILLTKDILLDPAHKGGRKSRHVRSQKSGHSVEIASLTDQGGPADSSRAGRPTLSTQQMQGLGLSDIELIERGQGIARMHEVSVSVEDRFLPPTPTDTLEHSLSDRT